MLKGCDFVAFITRGARVGFDCVISHFACEDGRFIRVSFKFKSINMNYLKLNILSFTFLALILIYRYIHLHIVNFNSITRLNIIFLLNLQNYIYLTK